MTGKMKNDIIGKICVIDGFYNDEEVEFEM